MNIRVAPDRGGEGALPKIVEWMGKAFPPLSAPGAAVQIAVRARVRGSRREAGDGSSFSLLKLPKIVRGAFTHIGLSILAISLHLPRLTHTALSSLG
jgi:hypothetical protein